MTDYITPLEPLAFGSLYEGFFDPNDCLLEDSEIGVFKPDQELFDNFELPSIKSDVEKITGTLSLGSYDNASFFDIKTELRNSDCMWSGIGSTLSTSASSSFSDVTTAFPLSTVTGNTQNIINNIKQEPVEPITIVANSNEAKIYTHHQPTQQLPTQLLQQSSSTQQPQQQQLQANPQQKQLQFQQITKFAFIKTEPNDEMDQSSNQIISVASNSSRQPLQQQSNSMQNIPPGTSLLRKSNVQHLKKMKLSENLSKATATATTTTTLSSGTMLISNGNHTIIKTNPESMVKGSNAFMSPNIFASTSSSAAASSASYVRPDTPHSLDDDATCMPFNDYTSAEFKRSIDLGACITGSNNINLPTDSHKIIQQLSQELQDSSKNEIDSRLIKQTTKDLADVLDVLSRDRASNHPQLHNIHNINAIAGKTLYDLYEESNAGSNSASSFLDSSDTIYKTSLQSPNSCQSSSSPQHCSSSHSTSSSSSSSSSSNGHQSYHHHTYAGYLHSDHSYTRYTDGMDDSRPNIETPSDSDEEIDVVSINDKKLPTNPSDKDRRVIQTKVADKFSNARVVKTSNGVRTIPPRRTASFEYPYTPASNSPEKSNSRYSSPASTPSYHSQISKYDQQLQHQHQQHQPLLIQQNDKARKRILQSSSSSSSSSCSSSNSSAYINVGIDYGHVAGSSSSILSTPTASGSSPGAIKRQRGKKSKHSLQQTPYAATSSACGSSGASTSSGVKRQFSLDENADTIEKRNLHNDMERQRRIGLKNLFETLKKQIPSIKDKERAPKVNILREAAKLCESLTYEDNQLAIEKAFLKEEQRKKKALLARLHSMQAIEIE